jgi:hypothetical protein
MLRFRVPIMKTKFIRLIAATAAICLPHPVLFADDLPLYDKTAYTLFNPAPESQMRPLASDEFDKVVNPFTVDAGHVQLEADLVEWYSGTQRGTFSSGETYYQFNALFQWSPTIKLGLCNSVDFEVQPSLGDSYSHQTGLNAPGYVISGAPATYAVSHSSDQFGAVDVGFKIN